VQDFDLDIRHLKVVDFATPAESNYVTTVDI
jgi:hypothetical protein